jgi:hypothetical protein
MQHSSRDFFLLFFSVLFVFFSGFPLFFLIYSSQFSSISSSNLYIFCFLSITGLYISLGLLQKYKYLVLLHGVHQIDTIRNTH